MYGRNQGAGIPLQYNIRDIHKIFIPEGGVHEAVPHSFIKIIM